MDEPEDHVVLLLGFHRDEIHAVLAANVPGVQPVHPLIGMGRHVSAVEVIVSTEVELLRSCKGKFRKFRGYTTFRFPEKILPNETRESQLSQL